MIGHFTGGAGTKRAVVKHEGPVLCGTLAKRPVAGVGAREGEGVWGSGVASPSASGAGPLPLDGLPGFWLDSGEGPGLQTGGISRSTQHGLLTAGRVAGGTVTHHGRVLALSLLANVLFPFGFLSVGPAWASPDDLSPFRLEVARLSVAPDLSSAIEGPEIAQVGSIWLAQAAPGAEGSAASPPQQSILGRRPLRQGSWEIGAIGAYSISGAGGPDIGTVVRAFWLFPHIGYTFWEVPWYPGSFQIALEPGAAFITTPAKTYAIGLNAVLRHTLLVWRQFFPYLEGGAGFLNTNLRTKALGESIEFLLQAGGGFHFFPKERFSLDAGFRWTHISNAGLADRNLGINSYMPYIGFTLYF